MNAAFVAEARRVYVPAAKWIRENPEWDRPRLRRWDRTVEIHLYEAWDLGVRRQEVVVVRQSPPTREIFAVASLKQAINHLVDAGVLPDEFHSLYAKPVDECDDCDGCERCARWAVEIAGSYYDEDGDRTYFVDQPDAVHYAEWTNRVFATRGRFGGVAKVLDLRPAEVTDPCCSHPLCDGDASAPCGHLTLSGAVTS